MLEQLARNVARDGDPGQAPGRQRGVPAGRGEHELDPSIPPSRATLKPLHSSSIGKALLGSLKEADLRAWFDGRTLPAITTSTITDPEALDCRHPAEPTRRLLPDARGVNVSDVWAVAPFFAVHNEVHAGRRGGRAAAPHGGPSLQPNAPSCWSQPAASFPASSS